jgi:hypothetical protein
VYVTFVTALAITTPAAARAVKEVWNAATTSASGTAAAFVDSLAKGVGVTAAACDLCAL